MVWAIFAIVVLALVFAMGWFLASYAVHGARYTREETFEDQCKQSSEAWALAKIKATEYEICDEENYELHVKFYPADETLATLEENTKYVNGESVLGSVNGSVGRKFLILVHGYTLNLNGEMKYIPLYRRLGYNCIVYDQPGHGLNAAHPCTFGLKEAKCLMAVIKDTYERYGSNIYLGLTGESLGAATEITALKYKPDVKWIVNDCGFADIIPVEQDGLRGMHLPAFFVYLADLACRVVYHFNFVDRRPIESLKDNHVPICFIHGDADLFINCKHSVQMAEATAGYKELHLVPGAAHAKSINVDPAAYEAIVDKFVRGVEAGTIV